MALKLALIIGIIHIFDQGVWLASCFSKQNFQQTTGTLDKEEDSSNILQSYKSSPNEVTTPTNVEIVSKRSFQKRSLDECPHGYNWKEDTITGYCFWETSYETSRLSWKNAREYCKSYGGDLASFHDVREEMIGLSFQYGSTEHPYWIGLSYNDSTHNFTWSDGSELDYINWGLNEPERGRLRSNCVQMDALSNHWMTSYCGQLSWFICKAPKVIDPDIPVTPTEEPIETCDSSDWFLFNGHCYNIMFTLVDHFEATTICKVNEAELVSIHDENELNFLLRILESNRRNLQSNILWIGLQRDSQQHKWMDSSPLDFVNWDNIPQNFLTSFSKCAAMMSDSGFWVYKLCTEPSNFICKKPHGAVPAATTIRTPTLPPGNCRHNWYEFNNRCYKIFGNHNYMKASWADAREKCKNENALLTSVRDAREQAFLTYLLQNYKDDAWIGLHDRYLEGRHQWTDVTVPLSFTMFATGEPSITGRQEDCVYMEYDNTISGLWKDDDCNTNMSFICESEKDPTITTAVIPKTELCPVPNGWLRQDSSCYMLYNDLLTYQAANQTCSASNARLLSVSDFTNEAVAKYLIMSANASTSFWIGLQIVDDYFLRWANGWPVTMSRWDANEPDLRKHDGSCFVSDNRGLWSSTDCDAKRSFICQVVSGKPPAPEKYCGSCPEGWLDAGHSCYRLFLNETASLSKSDLRCNSIGATLASVHSMHDVNLLKEHLIFNGNTYYIGLVRNALSPGFSWLDTSAIDFVYWDQGEPSSSNGDCVDIVPETLKWRVVGCNGKKNFICSKKKIAIKYNSSDDSNVCDYHYTSRSFQVQLSSGSVAAIVISLLILGIIIGTAIYYRHHWRTGWSLYTEKATVPVAFENALYDTHTLDNIQHKNSATLYVSDDNE